MSINAIGGYDFEALKFNPKVNPFVSGAAEGAQGRGEQPRFSGMQEQGLDSQMLARKAQNFQNGLGGTNNPDDHKIFFAA